MFIIQITNFGFSLNLYFLTILSILCLKMFLYNNFKKLKIVLKIYGVIMRLYEMVCVIS